MILNVCRRATEHGGRCVAADDRPGEVDLERAEREWRVAAEGGNGEAMNALGALLAARGDLESADVWLRRAVSSGVPAARYNLARVLELRGDHEGAEAVYRL